MAQVFLNKNISCTLKKLLVLDCETMENMPVPFVSSLKPLPKGH